MFISTNKISNIKQKYLILNYCNNTEYFQVNIFTHDKKKKTPQRVK